MPNTDAWGIDDGYWDIAGQWHPTSPQTHNAILAAMGGDGALPPRDDGSVRVVRPGETADVGRGTLKLEDGTTLSVEGHLPPDVPLGCHTFHAEGRATPIHLIVAPAACPLPPERTWGWAAQLYAARTAASWGIGDLADLARLGRWARGTGAKVLLINPLSAGAPVLPLEASPYYPGSRRFISPLYIRVEEAPGADRATAAVAQAANAGRQLNARRRIDRDAVLRLKLDALRAVFDADEPDADFAAYCREQGDGLRGFAIYCALSEKHGRDWRNWPADYRRHAGPAVEEFARGNEREIRFHQWLQWVADRQLAAAGREIALVQDLPIGVDPGGADAWLWQDLLAQGCTIGAPPDSFNLNGQNWSLPPFAPQKLRAAGYEPLRQTLRAMLRRAGGLRIDHVMGLFRLFWIPEWASPVNGTYVRYWADEMLGITAIEAHRAGAFVVGEDLGTVEPHVREQLHHSQMLSFRVMYFEPHGPEHYPPLAMAAVSTHDLPTLAGVWHGPGPAEGDVPELPGTGNQAALRQHVRNIVGIGEGETVEAVIEAAYRRLGQSPSLVVLATLDDALAVREQPNVPGTTHEWPNWSLALPGGIEALEAADLPRRIARAIGRG